MVSGGGRACEEHEGREGREGRDGREGRGRREVRRATQVESLERVRTKRKVVHFLLRPLGEVFCSDKKRPQKK